MATEYVVDLVLEVREYKGIKFFYLLWKNYDISECTWEPQFHVNIEKMSKHYLKYKDKIPTLTALQTRTKNTHFIRCCSRIMKLWKNNDPHGDMSSDSETSDSDMLSQDGISNGYLTRPTKLWFQKNPQFEWNAPYNIILPRKLEAKIGSFKYITKNTYHKSFSNRTVDETICCSCDSLCIPGICECTKYSDALYDDHGLTKARFFMRRNSLIFECSENCKCKGRSCGNRICQRNDVGVDNTGAPIYLEIQKSKLGGLGLVTQSDIKKGSYVMEYVGEIVDENEAEERGLQYDRQKISYLWSIYPEGETTDDFPTIDASFTGNVARFINHSCSPNLKAILFTDQGTLNYKHARVSFFARDFIRKGSELTINYNYDVDYTRDDHKKIKCNCGSSRCRGYLF